jgi:hypothetical protein
MITNFEKEMLERSFKFLEYTNTDPITLGKLQQIIHHASEEFDSIDEIKFKYLVENPNDKMQIIFGITSMGFIPEFNMLSFKTNKQSSEPKRIDDKLFESKIDKNNILSLKQLQEFIDSFKKHKEDWASMIINIENLCIPNMYGFVKDSVCIRVGET